MNSEEEKYMLRCIQLAQNGLCNTAPNPMVGAVIVCDGKIIGEGYHVRCGEAHAEVNAIRSVKDTSLLKRSTIYVSLEPCSHYGKTPPCADLIIEKQIPRIVIGCRDPFSKVAGRGIQKLKDAGREVIVGVLETECRQLIRRFITFHTLRRPYITLKWAESSDRYIDYSRTDGKPVILSSPLTSAPDFELPDQNGKIHRLSDYTGKKVILYFYPKDNTAGCTKQACGFSERYPQFTEKGAVILGVSKDSVSSHKRFESQIFISNGNSRKRSFQHSSIKACLPNL